MAGDFLDHYVDWASICVPELDFSFNFWEVLGDAIVNFPQNLYTLVSIPFQSDYDPFFKDADGEMRFHVNFAMAKPDVVNYVYTEKTWTDYSQLGNPVKPAALAFAGNLFTNRVYASGYDDLIHTLEGNDTVYAGAGDDVVDLGGIQSVYADRDALFGGAGDDVAYGGFDIDILHGDTDTDVLHGGLANDYVYGGTGRDALFGGDGNDLATGGDDDDLVAGGKGTDSVHGGTGNDMVDGQSGADRLYGGAGNDTMIVDDAKDQTFEDPGAGFDAVHALVDSWTLAANIEGLVYLGTGSFQGSGNALGNAIIGGAQADMLWGLAGGGDLKGRKGADVLFGGDDNDALWGEDDDDYLYAGNGDDGLNGGAGNDALHGEAGNDRLWGAGGKDWLTGGTGNDTLNGEAGSDTLEAGSGTDMLTGGTGGDRFVFRDIADSQAVPGMGTGYGADRISDFVRWSDRIDLSAIDAEQGPWRAGNQAFGWSADGTLNGIQGELVAKQLYGATWIFADVDGDAKADFTLGLSGLHALTASDFIL